MTFCPKIKRSNYARKTGWIGGLLLVLAAAFPATSRALPARLVLALDGVAYRDLKALQAGVTATNFWGKPYHRQAFTAAEGYFPVSRMVSTFPSTSDVAWTDIFGDRPLPGYQRTYFSAAANREISLNGVTTSMEHERQMNWQVANGFQRAMGYLFPLQTYEFELHEFSKNFWNTKSRADDYYAYVRASDDAQHLDRDIFAMLCRLDQQLQELRARYRDREGRDLQIVILSDHGHNHAGRGRRVEVRAFLEKAGYRIARQILGRQDVVLPTVGIESWVEIHNAPEETEPLAQLLCQLEGVDVLAARLPDRTNCFLVMNSKNERARIDWNPTSNSFRYATERGDPINYLPVVATLARRQQLDADNFGPAEAWRAASLTHHYPLAPERIVRGLTRVTLNPATILISLDNHYVNAGWWVQQGSRLVTCGSTHGGLDDLNSAGVLLTNFTPTEDTSSDQVAGLFENFPALGDFRTQESGAEWVTKKEQALTRIARVPLDREVSLLPDDGVCLRIWSPLLAHSDRTTPVTTAIEKIARPANPPSVRGEHKLAQTARLLIPFNLPLLLPDENACERIYALPLGFVLEAQTEYKISGEILMQKNPIRLFAFSFHTGSDGRPAAF